MIGKIYKSKVSCWVVKITKVDKDNYVYFRLNGVEQIVSLSSFLKYYKEVNQ